jgi:hypothetical protein
MQRRKLALSVDMSGSEEFNLLTNLFFFYFLNLETGD